MERCITYTISASRFVAHNGKTDVDFLYIHEQPIGRIHEHRMTIKRNAQSANSSSIDQVKSHPALGSVRVEREQLGRCIAAGLWCQGADIEASLEHHWHTAAAGTEGHA